MTDSFMENGVFNIRTASDGAKADKDMHIPVLDPKDVWKDTKQPWASSATGRLAIRSVSRGVMGAAFYAWGGQKATADMAGYDPDNPQNFVQNIASFFDKFAGRPIEMVVKRITNDEEKAKGAIEFRPTLTDRTRPRTLGEDAVDNTFNFAMATIGDKLGRNLVGMFDPNAESKWRNDEGKLSFPKALKSTVGATLGIFEAQLEDWFVAVPYAYQKRVQRRLIDTVSPGYAWDADRGLNGSSFKVDDNGEVTGTFAFEGALDLQGRFTGYNMGTMMFRDGMKSLKSKIHERFDPEQEDLKLNVPVTPKSLITGAAGAVKNAARYTIKSMVKATIIMTPSVPAFWTFRVGQGKYKSVALGKNGKALVDSDGENIRYNRDNWDTPTAFNSEGKEVVNPFAAADFDPYSSKFGITDALLNPFGRAARSATVKAQGITDKLADKHGLDKAHLRDFTDRYINGSMAYTPYIYTKNEFAHRWDTPTMDQAIYRAIDGMFGLSMGEIKAGAKEIRQALKARSSDVCASHPETVPNQYDRNEQAFIRHQAPEENADKNANSWRERVRAESDERTPSAER